MRNIYQCKVCFEKFSLLRYLRKHVTIPAVGDHQPNKCQSYYSGTGNLQENLKVNHKIVPENIPMEGRNCRTRGQRVQLISKDNQEKTVYLIDGDDSQIIEDEPSCLKFELDEQDELHFFDRDNLIVHNNDIANNSPPRFLHNENNPEPNFLADAEQVEASIKQTIFKRHNSHTIELRVDFLSAQTTEINSSAESTICKACKLDCTSLQNLCIHYETLHKLPVVVLARVIANQRSPKYERTEASYSEKAIRQTRTHQCDICSKRYATLKNLKRHESSVHDGKIFNCNVCQKTFSGLESLKRHKFSVHKGFHYKCNMCAKKFSNVSNLNRHKSSMHDYVRFTCGICQKQFNRLDILKEHKLNVHGNMRYKCNDCSKQYNSCRSLRFHKASIHKGVRYKCEMCEKQFRHELSLKNHKASIHKVFAKSANRVTSSSAQENI